MVHMFESNPELVKSKVIPAGGAGYKSWEVVQDRARHSFTLSI